MNAGQYPSKRFNQAPEGLMSLYDEQLPMVQLYPDQVFFETFDGYSLGAHYIFGSLVRSPYPVP